MIDGSTEPDPSHSAEITWSDFTITGTPTHVANSPEPASWAMMALGLGAVGFMARKNRNGRAEAAI